MQVKEWCHVCRDFINYVCKWQNGVINSVCRAAVHKGRARGQGIAVEDAEAAAGAQVRGEDAGGGAGDGGLPPFGLEELWCWEEGADL